MRLVGILPCIVIALCPGAAAALDGQAKPRECRTVEDLAVAYIRTAIVGSKYVKGRCEFFINGAVKPTVSDDVAQRSASAVDDFKNLSPGTSWIHDAMEFIEGYVEPLVSGMFETGDDDARGEALSTVQSTSPFLTQCANDFFEGVDIDNRADNGGAVKCSTETVDSKYLHIQILLGERETLLSLSLYNPNVK